MRFYEVAAKQGPQYYNGALVPWPDLLELFLGPSTPDDLHMEIDRGTRPGDMIFGGFNVVSQRFVDALESCKATGFRSFPIEVRRGLERIPEYYGLKILGHGGPLDEERSNVDRSEDGHAIFGHSAVYMDEAQWDGSDVFAIPGLGIDLFVTERVGDAIRKAKLVNVRLTLNSECRFGTRILRSDWDYPRRKRDRKRK